MGEPSVLFGFGRESTQDMWDLAHALIRARTEVGLVKAAEEERLQKIVDASRVHQSDRVNRVVLLLD